MEKNDEEIEVVEDVVEETLEETTEEENKVEKPKRTPQEELDYFEGRAKRLRKDLGIESPKEISKTQKSNGLDYGEKAYLTSNGIKGSKEFEFVQSELKSSGQGLDDLLENDYFQSRLEKFRALNKTSDAIPKGNRSGAVATDSVEYWAGKPIEDVPAEMRTKVVNHKLAKDKNKGVFYNS